MDELSKRNLLTGRWPNPILPLGFDAFENIDNISEIINKRKKYILLNNELYYSWILPKAVLLIGKIWFDKNKHYALFLKEEIQEGRIEDTTAGRAKIAKIIIKINQVLRKYLKNKKEVELASYIKRSIINEIKNEKEAKLPVLICPSCLPYGHKVEIIEEGNNIFSCPRCSQIIKSSNLDENTYKRSKVFSQFSGITCVCPNDNCKGKFAPISKDFIKYCNINSNYKKFISPPKELLNIEINCPFCNTTFTPKEVIGKKSGYKNKSGYLTGLPSSKIGKINIVPVEDNQIKTLPKDNILIKQKVNILVDEIIINLSKINKKTKTGIHFYFFLLSMIEWMISYSGDAVRYFYDGAEIDMLSANKKSSKIFHNGEIPIYQNIIQMWINNIEKNIEKIKKIERGFEIEKLKWLYKIPRINFKAEIKGNKIKCNFNKEKYLPRLVKVISVKNNTCDYTDDIEFYNWNDIYLKTTKYSGQEVNVEVLVMDGHPTSAPIKRIMKFRKLLCPIINKVLEEERTEITDMEFWKNWKEQVKTAKKLIGE